MKKALLFAGILFILAAVFALLMGGLFWYARTHTQDGSYDMYMTQFKMALFCLALFIVNLLAGIGCLVLRKKM